MHGRWLVLFCDKLLAARDPVGGTTLTQFHHTPSPAVGRQVGLGGCRGRVSSVCALTLGWWDDCFFVRARRLPSRQPVPPTRSADPSLPPVSPTPPSLFHRSHEKCEGSPATRDDAERNGIATVTFPPRLLRLAPARGRVTTAPRRPRLPPAHCGGWDPWEADWPGRRCTWLADRL